MEEKLFRATECVDVYGIKHRLDASIEGYGSDPTAGQRRQPESPPWRCRDSLYRGWKTADQESALSREYRGVAAGNRAGSRMRARRSVVDR